MGKKGMEMLEKLYLKHKIKRKVGTPIKSFNENSILFKEGSGINCDLNIFVPGGSLHPVLSA